MDGSDGPAVLAVGSATIDRSYALSNLPNPDESAYVRNSAERFGGVAANDASALARFDRDVALLARVGDDSAGDRIVSALCERGVSLSIQRGTDERSTYCLVFRDRNGNRAIVAGGESAEALTLDAEAIETLRSARVVFVDAYVPDAVTSRIVEEKRTGAFALAFDLAGPMAELADRGVDRDTIDALLPVADLFVANEAATRSYLDRTPRDAVAELRDRGLTRGAITRGERGALLLDGETTTAIPAVEVETIDTTGAGDVFTAGLIDAWVLDDRGPRTAGRFAAGAAALSCTAVGARGRLPTVRAVEAFLASE